jgi:hypothetical protein
MSFVPPAPDLAKIFAAWEEFETGGQQPGWVLANMKSAGLSRVLAELVEQGWKPSD